MKLIIFGATGGTGSQLMKQALKNGHTVTAFARNPAKLSINHQNLNVITGDVLDAASVQNAVPGHDAALCCLGSPASKIGNIRSQGTLNIIRAMEKYGLKKFICQTSLGYGDSVEVLDQTPWFFKNLIVPFILKKGFANHALQEEYIKQSGLDWTIIRPGNLTDGPHTGVYKHGFSYNDKTLTVKVSRADVADLMLKQLDIDTDIHQTIGISY
nr:SDR family oxidoreductase [uncultured Mucilaginibacter sp.]